MYIKPINTFLDFLTIKLDKTKISSRFWACVENSPIIDSTFLFWFPSYISFDMDYHTHRIYYGYDNAWNKLFQIMIVSNLNKRSDFYDKITFYWIFFNFYKSIFYDVVVKIFWFYWITELSQVTRFDIKNDINYIPYLKNEYYSNNNTKKQGNTWLCYSNKWKNTSATYEFRIYDKKLHIIQELYKFKDNDWNYLYKDLLLNDSPLWRIEVQYNSKKIKEKKIKLSHLFDLDFLHQELLNYSFQFLKNSWETWKIYFKSWDKKNDISTQKLSDVIYHSKTMIASYIEKLSILSYEDLLDVVLKAPWLSWDYWFKDFKILKWLYIKKEEDYLNQISKLKQENFILRQKLKKDLTNLK